VTEDAARNLNDRLRALQFLSSAQRFELHPADHQIKNLRVSKKILNATARKRASISAADKAAAVES
jgi:hypothetical protein